MNKALAVGLREPNFGLPTACPSSLTVYTYCVLGGIPFQPWIDNKTFDSDGAEIHFLGKVSRGVENLIKDGIVNIDFDFKERTTMEAGALRSLVNIWLGDAVSYEIWILKSSLAFRIYFPQCSTEEDQCQEHTQKISLAKEHLGLIGGDTTSRIEEIYKKATIAYDALSAATGQNHFFFENRPTSLDAVFLAHAMFTLFVLPETSRLQKMLREHTNLVEHIKYHSRELEGICSWPSLVADSASAPAPPRERTNLALTAFEPPKELKYHHLVFYSRNFKEKLSEGSFGEVYKGWVIEPKVETDKGLMVAIKVSHTLRQTEERRQWNTEMKYLYKMRHDNIIKLLGHCEHVTDLLPRSHKMALFLVYEYMENGSVSRMLEDLDWTQTKRIARGSAAAMKHLHDQTPPLIFRDFKPSNLLLDEQFNPKLGDFGLVREEHQKLRIGTRGYTDPVTIKCGEGTKETDIYSMGVLLMQLITKIEQVINVIEVTETEVLQQHIMIDIKESYESGNAKVHEKLLNTGCNESYAKIITALAIQCVEDDQAARPTIDEVIQELSRLD